MVYADREFYAADVMHALENRDITYVIPVPRDDRIGRICDRFDRLKRGFADDDGDVQLYVKNEYALYGQVRGETTSTPVETNVVILPPDEDDDTHEEGTPQPFATNSWVSNEIRLDRVKTMRKIQRYDNRAAIESSYPSIKECAAWTTSREFEIRWFHFAFACCVYNLWLLIDFLVQERIGVIETQRSPRLSLQRFLEKFTEVYLAAI